MEVVQGTQALPVLGGVFGNKESKVTGLFSGPIGVGDSLRAEILAVMQGVQKAKDMNVKKLIIEGDSKLVVDWMQKESGFWIFSSDKKKFKWLTQDTEAVALFKSYFGGAFDEDAIRNNFVLIYELLDEIMDFGYPQNLAPEILKLYITQEGVRSPFSSKPADKPVPNATLQVTGAVGWRREGLVYKKNEVFLDIVESVNLLMSSKGSHEVLPFWNA
uniref:RNase H type-1 domain-containing protein n=1 Tax=Nelumbo nucifera TaxID=4432 RepID=A0A822ZW09_NELNU|nr:TPA_asm: hypothetical protein HUJ06_017452 [Nelumbo nucifera]